MAALLRGTTMKKVLKWHWSTFFALMVLTVLSVALTGRQMTEEKTKLGVTVAKPANAVTYIKEIDCSVESPKDWKRYFPDTGDAWMREYMGKMQEVFSAEKDNSTYIMEVAADVVPVEALNGIDDLSDADDRQKEEFIQVVKEHLTNQVPPYTLESELNSEIIELEGKTYVRTYYQRKATAYAEFNVVADYSTVLNGHFVDFSNYYMSREMENTEEIIPGLDKVFEPLMSLVTKGDATKGCKDAADSKSFLQKTGSFTFGIWIFLIPLLYFFAYNMTYASEKNQWHEDVLSLSTSKSLLGFFAVLIIFHHLVQKIGSGNASVFGILENLGVCFVSVFFFFSGYGLLVSWRSKPDYLKGFFRKRMPSVLVPFYLCNAIFIFAAVISGQKITAGKLLGWASGFLLLNTQMWYIVEIVLFYIVFFLVFRFAKTEKAALFGIGIFLVFFTIGSLLLGHGDYWFQGEWWFNSSLLFYVGILFARYEKNILRFLKRFYCVTVLMAVFLFLLFYRLTVYMLGTYSYWSETEGNPAYGDKLRCLSVQLPMIVFFMLLIILIGMKIKFKNAVLDFLGKISLELYLIHNFFITYGTEITGSGMYVLMVIVCSILAAFVLHEADDIIICKLLKKKRPPKKKIMPQIKASFKDTIFWIWYVTGYAKRHPKAACRYMFREIICFLIACITIFPIYIMFINATRTSYSMVQGLSFLPEGQFMDNLAVFITRIEGSSDGGIMQALGNSCLIAVSYCLLASYFGAMTAYGFELFKFKGKKVLWCIVVATLMISPLSSFIGFYNLMLQLNWINSFLPLIIPAIATPSTVFFMRMYLRTLHLNEIAEAARIDGCSEFGIFNRIILPAIKPALSLQIIFTYVFCWNNSFAQGMLLQEAKKKTIAIYMNTMVGDTGAGSNPVTYVILLLTTLPPLVVYILFAKGIVSRIVLGAVKE